MIIDGECQVLGVAQQKTNNYWLSWVHPRGSRFTLHSPWWITGYVGNDYNVCAAVRARSESEAKEIVLQAFDHRPKSLEWRFCVEREPDWSPMGERFPGNDWMQWEGGAGDGSG